MSDQHQETTVADHAAALSIEQPLVPSGGGGQGNAGMMLNFLAARAARGDIAADELKILLDMQRQVIADDAREQFGAAKHRAQIEMPKVSRAGTIEMGQKGAMKFATWEDVDAIARPIMQKHGFSVSFSAEPTEGGRSVYSAIFTHIAGHTEKISLVLPPDQGPGRNALQAIGSSSSYAKRYLVENFFNIIRKGQDDDGNRGGTEYVSDEVAEAITAELAKRKIPPFSFFDLLGVRSANEIETKDLAKARNALRSYKAPAP